MPVIELRDVTRRFGDLTAVDHVTLDVHPGQIVGLLGHNGAGKTTLLRVINGLLPPDTGTVTVHGLDPGVDGNLVRAQTGVLTEYPALEVYLSTRENLEVYAAISGVPKAVAAPRIDVLLERLGLGDKQDEPARKLSAGLKQRVALARALVHDPSLLLLDEPTTNMDPVAARTVRTLVKEAVAEQGRTVLLSTHNLAEAEELCDRVAIMRNGRVLVEGSPAELRRSLGAAAGVELTIEADQRPLITQALTPRWQVVHTNGATTRVRISAPDTGDLAVPEVVAAAVTAGVHLHRVDPLEPTLEDLYVTLHADEHPAPTPPPPGPAGEVTR